jgi:hypothetical protein
VRFRCRDQERNRKRAKGRFSAFVCYRCATGV